MNGISYLKIRATERLLQKRVSSSHSPNSFLFRSIPGRSHTELQTAQQLEQLGKETFQLWRPLLTDYTPIPRAFPCISGPSPYTHVFYWDLHAVWCCIPPIAHFSCYISDLSHSQKGILQLCTQMLYFLHAHVGFSHPYSNLLHTGEWILKHLWPRFVPH